MPEQEHGHQKLALAVDVGGTKVAVGVVSRDGEILESRQAPSGDDPWSAIETLIAGTTQSSELVVCGVGCGGPMSEKGDLLTPLNIPAWRRLPVAGVGWPRRPACRRSSTTTPRRWPSARAGVGAAPGVRNYIAMVVSTGVGGGIVLDGRLLDGADGNAGHIGHVIVEPDGRPCGCGARGCLEAEASGRRSPPSPAGPRPRRPPRSSSATGRLVGRAVASVANLLDLPLAVVAGSVALGFGEPFFAAAQAELDARSCLDFSRGAAHRPGRARRRRPAGRRRGGRVSRRSASH